jgi:hypothetical protein
VKTKFTMFPRKGVFYMQDTTTSKQTSLRTKDETEARSLLNAENEAHRQPVLNLQLARAYLAASDPAFTQRTWQSVMEHFQARGKESSLETAAASMPKDITPTVTQLPSSAPDNLAPETGTSPI